MKKILLVCSAGMSTSLLVNRMKEAASEQGIESDISAVSIVEAESIIQTGEVDVVMVGPQIRFAVDDLIKKYGDIVPIAMIDTMDYGTMNGPAVLSKALKMIGEE